MNPYEQIFESYLGELRAAQALAASWWSALLAQEVAQGADAEQAEAAVDLRWPMGPVSHPAVIAVFRKWALECQRLNDAIEDDDSDAEEEEPEEDEDAWGADDEEEDGDEDLGALEGPVEPRDLLIEMLAQRAEDMAEFMADFVFTPLGLDKNDRWI